MVPARRERYAEYVTAPARQFARKPAPVDHVHAAAVPLAALTAWQAVVDTAHVQAGQRVLITAAAGGVGHFAVQFARHLGAHVIATARAARHTWLKDLGADETIDYTTARFEDAVADVDVVIDLVGDAHDRTSTRSLKVLRPGRPAGRRPGRGLPGTGRGRRGGRCTGHPVPGRAGRCRADHDRGLIDAGEVAVEVEETFPFEQAAAAHARGEAGRTRGKLVLTVTD